MTGDEAIGVLRGQRQALYREAVTCDLNTFLFEVGNRGASIRLPREVAVVEAVEADAAMEATDAGGFHSIICLMTQVTMLLALANCKQSQCQARQSVAA